MLQSAWLAMEAQQVIALRLMKLAMGGAAATQEAHLMVAEKVDASTKAAGMVAAAMARGTFDGGADAVLRMLRHEVQANRTRLGSSRRISLITGAMARALSDNPRWSIHSKGWSELCASGCTLSSSVAVRSTRPQAGTFAPIKRLCARA